MSNQHSEDSESSCPHNPELILQTIRDGIYTLDEHGQITWVNEVTVTEFDLGYTREELIGTHVRILLSKEDVKKCRSIIADLRAIDERDSGRCEITLQTKYGTEIPVELHLTLLPTPDGKFRGTAGVMREITHRKQRQQWLEVLNRVLRHNLRNQMTIISGRLELARDDLPAATHPHLAAIDEAIDEFLDLSEKTTQIQNALMEADQTEDPVDVAAITTAICQEFQEQESDADVSVKTPATAWAQADRSLAVAIENLLENAVEHSDRETPSVDVVVQTTTMREHVWVEIQVADDGPGIPPAELKAIKKGKETPLKHTTGLGLWLVKWLVDRYGGNLEFSDRSPRGSLITIRLPHAESQ